MRKDDRNLFSERNWIEKSRDDENSHGRQNGMGAEFGTEKHQCEPKDAEFLTVEEAAKELNVSTKTISRWRKQGLESEKRLIASRNRVVIRREALRTFAEAQPKRVEKGRKFPVGKARDRGTSGKNGGGRKEIDRSHPNVGKKYGPQCRNDPLHTEKPRRASSPGRYFSEVSKIADRAGKESASRGFSPGNANGGTFRALREDQNEHLSDRGGNSGKTDPGDGSRICLLP